MGTFPEFSGCRGLVNREWSSYEELHQGFRWSVLNRFNLAATACDRLTDDDKGVAMYARDVGGSDVAPAKELQHLVGERLARCEYRRGTELINEMPKKTGRELCLVELSERGGAGATRVCRQRGLCKKRLCKDDSSVCGARARGRGLPGV